jgi:soluble lytic murein transglycosylase-like protein
MKRGKIKFMIALLIVAISYTGVQLKITSMNKRHKYELEQYSTKLEEKIKLTELQKKQLQEVSDKLNQLQIELDRQLNRVQQLQDSLKEMSVKTDIQSNIYNYILTVAIENNYRPEMLFGIIETESEWKLNLVSSTNDYGLCQINQSNLKYYKPLIINKYGSFDVFNPYMNIDMMIMNLNEFRYLYQKKFNSDPTEASLLLAYNSGNIRQNYSGNTYTNKVLNNTVQYERLVHVNNELSNMRKIFTGGYPVSR